MKRHSWIFFLFAIFPFWTVLENVEILAESPKEPADLIVHNAKVLTVDSKFSVAEAVAVRGEYVVAVGDSKSVLKQRGPKTVLIDAKGKTVMPGLYDSHVHPLGRGHERIRRIAAGPEIARRRLRLSQEKGERAAQGPVDRHAVRLPDAAEGSPIPYPGGAGQGGPRQSGALQCRAGEHGQQQGP